MRSRIFGRKCRASLRRKLARGIREGDFEAAIWAFERASAEHGSDLYTAVRREAPTLYAALWPRVERVESGSDSKPNRFGFVLGWRWLWLILILARCAFSGSDRPSRSTYVAPHRPSWPRVPRPSPPAPPRPAEGELTNLQRNLVERSIDEAIERHDCATLFEQWPLYEGSFTSREEKRRAALAACPELAPTLK